MINIGEYWYIELGKGTEEYGYYPCKVLGFVNDKVLVKLPVFWSPEKNIYSRERLLTKWEPGIFWRLLGYK